MEGRDCDKVEMMLEDGREKGLVDRFYREWQSLAATFFFLCGWTQGGDLLVPKLDQIDEAIEASIAVGEIPGAVVWLESKGEIYHRAYGNRVVSPSRERMTKDTIFDVASLTKVLATTTAILHLAEGGRLDLDSPVHEILPEFLEGGIRPEPKDPEVQKSDRELITVKHLLTHQSGLPPGLYLSEKDFWGHDEGVRRAATIGLLERPETVFRYSDVNFILLGEIVARVSGQRLDEYTEAHLFGPLGMHRSGFLPTGAAQSQIAPTTDLEGFGLLRGLVHDPTARRMQGVAGHAGLFSTAADIATFLRVLMKAEPVSGIPILSPATVAAATSNQLSETIGVKRGLGWDIGSRFAYQRGEKFPLDGYGHTGWTGTSIWVDPASESFLILLTNRNHPSEEGRIRDLRIAVGTLAAEAVGYTEAVPLSSQTSKLDEESFVQTAAGESGLVLNGVDALERDGFEELQGLRIGLITNQTGISRTRRSTIDLLASAEEVDLRALFSPEHGIRGVLEQDSVDDTRDAATGLPVFSLYKTESRKPTSEQLAGLDALVFDIQDIGCRFYTYISTMGLAMEAAAENDLRFIVLDRINPIGGVVVDGPIRSGEGNDFVAYHSIPVQHGMTVGELAMMFNEERGVGADLTVVPLVGWNPSMTFEDTRLPWVNPSPNIRSATQAKLYPGVGLIEFTDISVGRGTRSPFEHIGAPWIHEGKLARELERENIPGVAFFPTRFTPDASVFVNEDCGGVRFVITNRKTFRPIDLGIALMRVLYASHPDTFNLEEKGNVLLRHAATIEKVLAGEEIAEIREGWGEDFDDFLKRREEFLLYPR
ncbi:MAG: exo-beta-N-acetylmuramidase NamZ domain-containing protein [Verrucomicrobiota bacterium]